MIQLFYAKTPIYWVVAILQYMEEKKQEGWTSVRPGDPFESWVQLPPEMR
jgi:hypothetical protein